MLTKITIPLFTAIIAVVFVFAASSFNDKEITNSNKEITSVNENGMVTYQFILKSQSSETTSAARRNPANYNYKGSGETCPSGSNHQCVIYAERVDTDMDGNWEPVIPSSGALYDALHNNNGALPLSAPGYVELKQ